MYNSRSIFTGMLALVFAVLLASCSGDDNPSGPGEAYDFSLILQSFSQNVAVGTYADMKAKGAELNLAVQAFADDPTNQTKLDAVGEAWKAMRAPWEASEAFLFGPAEFLSLDPSLDSWPVDRQQLDDVLASNFELTADFVAEGLGPALRGFHTVEYLVFRDGSVRSTGDFTVREREYLVAVAQVLGEDAATLHDEWADGFADEVANAGGQGSRYGSQLDAVQEIIDGMIGILDEVANGKIADPFDEQDVQLVESQFSWNSLTDFANNIRSVQNAYMGGYHIGADGAGLNEFVASKDATLDTRVQAEIQAAITAIGLIPEPFRNNLTATTPIEAAQTAILTVMNTLQADVKPLLSE